MAFEVRPITPQNIPATGIYGAWSWCCLAAQCMPCAAAWVIVFGCSYFWCLVCMLQHRIYALHVVSLHQNALHLFQPLVSRSGLWDLLASANHSLTACMWSTDICWLLEDFRHTVRPCMPFKVASPGVVCMALWQPACKGVVGWGLSRLPHSPTGSF